MGKPEENKAAETVAASVETLLSIDDVVEIHGFKIDITYEGLVPQDISFTKFLKLLGFDFNISHPETDSKSFFNFCKNIYGYEPDTFRRGNWRDYDMEAATKLVKALRALPIDQKLLRDLQLQAEANNLPEETLGWNINGNAAAIERGTFMVGCNIVTLKQIEAARQAVLDYRAKHQMSQELIDFLDSERATNDDD